jgi:rhamnosyltransferase
MKKHVFIIGSKGIPASYGGFETFVEKLVTQKVSDQIIYHVACKGKENTPFIQDNVKCFYVPVPEWIGPSSAIVYDICALRQCIKTIKKEQLQNCIIYVLACRIGPFIKFYKNQLKKLNCRLYVNPDGHEWKRAKWCAPIRSYWKCSERLMVKHADLLICDSKNIEKYIQHDYAKYNPKTTFIAYGADISPSILKDDDSKLTSWYTEKGLKKKEYYLVVGRFVPENNFEIMIREFMKSKTQKSFALITNVSKKFLEELKVKTGFEKDPRIKFVGTVYDQELLKKIRENAYGYFHGHEVGGTNPSLLEALASTDLNLLLDVGFNREVAENTALYWNKELGNLAKTIEEADSLNPETISQLAKKSTQRIEFAYSWEKIINDYENLFLEMSGKQ